MGNSLPKPITLKDTERGKHGSTNDETRDVRWAASSMQGWRVSMEDAHVAEEFTQVTDPSNGETIYLGSTHYFFGVLDGHGGTLAANYSSKHFFQIFLERPELLQYARLVGHVVPNEQDDLTKAQSSTLAAEAKTQPRCSSLSEEVKTLIPELLQKALEDWSAMTGEIHCHTQES